MLQGNKVDIARCIGPRVYTETSGGCEHCKIDEPDTRIGSTCVQAVRNFDVSRRCFPDARCRERICLGCEFFGKVNIWFGDASCALSAKLSEIAK
jgi:hypothetical protein